MTQHSSSEDPCSSGGHFEEGEVTKPPREIGILPPSETIRRSANVFGNLDDWPHLQDFDIFYQCFEGRFKNDGVVVILVDYEQLPGVARAIWEAQIREVWRKSSTNMVCLPLIFQLAHSPSHVVDEDFPEDFPLVFIMSKKFQIIEIYTPLPEPLVKLWGSVVQLEMDDVTIRGLLREIVDNDEPASCKHQYKFVDTYLDVPLKSVYPSDDPSHLNSLRTLTCGRMFLQAWGSGWPQGKSVPLPDKTRYQQEEKRVRDNEKGLREEGQMLLSKLFPNQFIPEQDSQRLGLIKAFILNKLEVRNQMHKNIQMMKDRFRELQEQFGHKIMQTREEILKLEERKDAQAKEELKVKQAVYLSQVEMQELAKNDFETHLEQSMKEYNEIKELISQGYRLENIAQEIQESLLSLNWLIKEMNKESSKKETACDKRGHAERDLQSEINELRSLIAVSMRELIQQGAKG